MSASSFRRSPQGERPAQAGSRAGPLAHLLLNGALAAVFTALFFRAATLPSSMWEPLGSGSFPRLVLAVLVVINMAIVVKEVRVFASQPPGERGQVAAWVWRHRLAFGVLGLFAAYIIVMPWLGFALASLVFLMIGQGLLGARSIKGVVIALVVALVFSFGVDSLFRDVFVISLPRGLLG